MGSTNERLMINAITSAARTAPRTRAVSRRAAVRAVLDSAVTLAPNCSTAASVTSSYWSLLVCSPMSIWLLSGDDDEVAPISAMRLCADVRSALMATVVGELSDSSGGSTLSSAASSMPAVVASAVRVCWSRRPEPNRTR